MQYSSFCAWLISLSTLPSTSSMLLQMTISFQGSIIFHCVNSLYFHNQLNTEADSTSWLENILQWIRWHRYLFDIPVFIPSRSGIAGLYGSSFSFLRTLHTVFQKWVCNLHSHQQYTGISLSHVPNTSLTSFYLFCNARNWTQGLVHPKRHCGSFLVMVIIIQRVGGKNLLILICIFLIIVKHFFIYLLAICMSSFGKCLFNSFAYFLIWLFSRYWVPCIIWILVPY